MNVVTQNALEITRRIPDGLTFRERAKWLLGEEAVERDFVSAHSHGVAYYSAKLAGFIGMSDEQVSDIKFGAIIHDIGKLAVPDDILRFRGRLSPEAMADMKEHAAAGGILLGDDAPEVIKNITVYHHERYDGLGYNGLRGEEIPFEARIVQIADCHDALMQARDYKTGMSEEQALSLMTQSPEDRGNFGRFGFDPVLLRKFVLMRLVDIDFVATLSKEGKKALTEYAQSAPMNDFNDRLVDGWKIDPNGTRSFKYVDNASGNEKTAEIRNPQGGLIFGPTGPRAVREETQTAHLERDADFSSSYRY